MKLSRTLYFEKKQELVFFIHSISILYRMNDRPNNPYSFYLTEKIGSNSSYNLEDFLVILKSNSFIMMYNVIESTIKNTVDHMYNEINSKNVKYTDVCEQIRKIWFKYHFNENTAADKIKHISKEIVDDIIAEKKIVLDFEKFKISGNADLQKIKSVFSTHGLEIDSTKVAPYGSSLLTVKDKRNSLAHGSESFIDSAKDFSEVDIKNFSEHVFNLLEFVMDEVDSYIIKEKYKF